MKKSFWNRALWPLLGLGILAVVGLQARPAVSPSVTRRPAAPPPVASSRAAAVAAESWVVAYPGAEVVVGTDLAGTVVVLKVQEKEYQKIFQTRLREDSQAAGRWETAQGGEYFAAGVGGAITGRGADLLIIDDPHSEQDALNPEALERAYEWYTSGPRQRLQPGGKIVVVMTRWSVKDLTAQLIKSSAETKADQWELIEFPAILPTNQPVWPEYWKLSVLESVKASLSLQKWNAQWMQNPTAEEGSIIKREWWRISQGPRLRPLGRARSLPVLHPVLGPLELARLDAVRHRHRRRLVLPRH